VDTSEVTPWDFISMPDCKEIAIYQKNWSSFFEQLLTRPEDASISGGKEAKTDWIIRINTVKSKLSNKTYSVPFEEFTFVSSVYEWITDVLIM
jgi:DNA sulfur modification protein DndB